MPVSNLKLDLGETLPRDGGKLKQHPNSMIRRSDRPRNLDLLKKKWTSVLGLETGPGGSRGGSGAGRALAGAERRPKKSPERKKWPRHWRGGARAGAIFFPPATFWAGTPRRPARGRPQTLRRTPQGRSRGPKRMSTFFSEGPNFEVWPTQSGKVWNFILN